MSVSRSFLALLIVGVFASPAAAQIYSWRDMDGKLVLSDKPRPDSGAQTTYEVHGAATVRASKPVVSTTKSAPFEASITEHARRQRVAADLVRAVIQVESAFNPIAVSSKGAMGLMQLMPATAVELGVVNPFDPDQNIRGGVTYLRQLLDRYDGNVEVALAAYNAGIGNVAKYGGDVPPFKETKNYVKKITGGVAVASPAPVAVIYKWFELVNGKPSVRYSNKPPAAGSYEILGRR
jgi:soluble lytic murein transglycosylase-like protein